MLRCRHHFMPMSEAERARVVHAHLAYVETTSKSEQDEQRAATTIAWIGVRTRAEEETLPATLDVHRPRPPVEHGLVQSERLTATSDRCLVGIAWNITIVGAHAHPPRPLSNDGLRIIVEASGLQPAPLWMSGSAQSEQHGVAHRAVIPASLSLLIDCPTNTKAHDVNAYKPQSRTGVPSQGRGVTDAGVGGSRYQPG